MNVKTKAVLITLVFGLPAFFLGPILWPPSPALRIADAQLPFFVFLSLVEALTFGLGLAFIFLGWPKLMHSAERNNTSAIGAFIALTWMLVSWWPHDNLHAHVGLNTADLLGVEYAFHVTLMIAALVVAKYAYSKYATPGKK